MQVSEQVKGFFATRDRTNILATAGRDGKPNVGAFGSPSLVNDETMAMMLGDNRTFRNLAENPQGVFLIILHGAVGMGMKGCRLYVTVKETADAGEKFDAMIAPIRERIGAGADMLKHYVEFAVTDARPIVDFGQGV
ncbi:MAG: pyridoxamine 5'-phosphate oxidase family protein [Thermodesulfobacteriota bacterium]